jgi:hypothetical protein
MRLLVSLLLCAVVTACGASSTDDAPPGNRAADVAFLTELMHRDAALLNLLDVALGRPLDQALVAATDQLRADANARIETAADQLESWGEKVPRTVRDHAFEHSTDAHDIPSLDGMATGDDLQKLGPARPAAFESAFVAVLRPSLEATRDLAGSHIAAADSVRALAREAEQSCQSALDAL